MVTHRHIFDETLLVKARRPAICKPCQSWLPMMLVRVFSFSTDCPRHGAGRTVVHKKEAVAQLWLNSTFNSVYECGSEHLRI